MRLALVIAFTLAGCVPPQQPMYYQQSAAGQPPPVYGAPAPVAAAASCSDTLNCYGQCNPMTDACLATCDQRTTPASSQEAHAVLQCMAQSGCTDQSCVAQRCGTPITTCTNITLAAAPTQPSSVAGPDEVMQPEYNYGSLWIPPPKRILQQSDLAGEWHANDGAAQAYATSSGQDAGFNSVSISTVWNVDAKGGFREKFKAAYAGNQGVRGVDQNNVGTFTTPGNNTITMDYPAQNGNKAYTEYYIIVGWFVGPDVIMMKLQGGYRDPITSKQLSEATSNSYMNHTYVKKR